MLELPSINWVGAITAAGTAVTIFTVIVAWFIRLERRFGDALTRQEHQTICEKNHQEVKAALCGLESLVKCQDEKANTFRETAQQKLSDIQVKLSPLELRLSHVEKDVQGMRDWKHISVDPYVPRAIDEHERRLNRLDTKVFA